MLPCVKNNNNTSFNVNKYTFLVATNLKRKLFMVDICYVETATKCDWNTSRKPTFPQHYVLSVMTQGIFLNNRRDKENEEKARKPNEKLNGM